MPPHSNRKIQSKKNAGAGLFLMFALSVIERERTPVAIICNASSIGPGPAATWLVGQGGVKAWYFLLEVAYFRQRMGNNCAVLHIAFASDAADDR